MGTQSPCSCEFEILWRRHKANIDYGAITNAPGSFQYENKSLSAPILKIRVQNVDWSGKKHNKKHDTLANHLANAGGGESYRSRLIYKKWEAFEAIRGIGKN